MAPGIHPPCTPAASCAPLRCHPTPPPCRNPEKCLKRTLSKRVKPCQSALSVLSTRSLAKCSKCGKCKRPRSAYEVEKFLKRKSDEASMRRRDRLEGTHRYLKYTRSKGHKKSKNDCCAGHGHRGRVKRRGCCEIL